MLTAESPTIPEPPRARRSSGRRTRAGRLDRLADNPLTARVMVNRLWQHHFGRGIVRSPNNFGNQGTPPTHPELLDWLASEFVDGGWQLKPLHRLILTSNAYRMSSQAERGGAGQGSGERPALALRHAAAGGRGDPRLDPRGQRQPEPARWTARASIPRSRRKCWPASRGPGDGWGKSSARGAGAPQRLRPRQAVAGRADPGGVRRARPRRARCPVRFATTQPTQALGMLNGEFLNEQAGVFADDVRKEAGDDAAAQVRLALRRVDAARRRPRAEIDRGVDVHRSAAGASTSCRRTRRCGSSACWC